MIFNWGNGANKFQGKYLTGRKRNRKKGVFEMKSNREWLIVFVAALCITLASVNSTDAKVVYLGFCGGSATGVYYFMAGGFSHIIEKYVAGIKSTPISTEASVENLNLLEREKIELAFAEANAMLSLIKRERIKNIRLIGGGYVSPIAWIVRKESPIKRIEDFRGKKIGVGAVGSGTIGNKAMLEAGYGITFDDIKPQMLAFGPMADGLKDGTLDVIGIPAGLPAPVITDLATSINIRFIPMEKDAVEKVMKKYAYIPSVIPAKTYPNQPNDIPTMAHECLGLRSQASNEFAL
jgi:TRAP transporter TAXI family solute receptor